MHSKNLQNARVQFKGDNFAVIPNFLDTATASKWANQSKELLSKASIPITRNLYGKRLSYNVVTGEVIREHASEIFRFYRSKAMRHLIQTITNARKVYNSKNLRSSININYLHAPHQVYRWHLDAEPYTAVLFLTSLDKHDGGAFLLKPPQTQRNKAPSTIHPKRSNKVKTIRPKSGSLIVMDGSLCAHSVAPMRRESDRITLLMVYPKVRGRTRPANLDDYLYDGRVIDENFVQDPNLS